MPIYEYQCGKCEHRFEEIQKISEPLLVDCPNCHEPTLKKLVSAAGFRLKGSGWYETDFKSGNKKNLVEGSAGGSDPASANSNETKKSDDKSGSGDKSGTKEASKTSSESKSSSNKKSSSD